MSGPSARDRMLGRVRVALAALDPVEHPGALDAWPESSERPVHAFRRRFTASGGEVVLLPDLAAARAWLRGFAHDFGSMAAGVGIPDDRLPDLIRADPSDADLGISRALAAAADTGTVILRAGEGRRSQLLPPVHLVWLAAAAVHARLTEAMTAVRHGSPGSVVALHSGPSKSADIGRITVTGVHGPGRVVVGVVGLRHS